MSNRKDENWFDKAADKMVREQKSLVAVASEMELNIPSRELMNIERRKSFQQALWAAKNRVYKEIAADPDRDKNAVLGQLTLAADELMKQGKYKDAAEVLLKIAKVQGWVGDGTNVNVFGNLSASELEQVRQKVKNLTEKESLPN